MSSTPESRHDSAIDTLRILAVLAVVLIHTTTRRLEITGYHLNDFSFTLFLNQVTRFGTPLFFMVSGFVLQLTYPKQIILTNYLKKRLKKLVLPYIFWSLIYYYLVYRQHTHGIFQSFLTGDASYQLYFIPAIFLLYLLFPLFRYFRRFIFRTPVLLLLGFVQILLLSVDYYVRPLNFISPLNAVLLNYFLFLIGMFAAMNREKILNIYQHRYKVIAPITVSLGILIFWEARSGFYETQNYLSFYSQWRPTVFFYTLLTGWFFYGFFTRYTTASKVVHFLSPLVYFIFYAHVAVLELLWIYLQPFYLIPGFDIYYFLLVFLFSAVLGFFISKIPFAPRLTG